MTSVNEMNAHQRGVHEERKRIKDILLAEKRHYLTQNKMARAKVVQWIIDEV